VDGPRRRGPHTVARVSSERRRREQGPCGDAHEQSAARRHVSLLLVGADERSLSMKLYHCTGSRSTRVLWLLEELGLDYELEVMPFDPKALKSSDYLVLSPFGKVPVLVDDTLTMF